MTDPINIAQLIEDERAGNAGRRAWLATSLKHPLQLESGRAEMLEGAVNTIERLLLALESTTQELEADFKTRMTNALTVNETRLDEIQNLKEKVQAFEQSVTYWQDAHTDAQDRVHELEREVAAEHEMVHLQADRIGDLEREVARLTATVTALNLEAKDRDDEVARLKESEQDATEWKVHAEQVARERDEADAEVARLRKLIADEEARSAFHSGLYDK